MAPSVLDSWPDEDQVEAAALIVYERTLCPGCHNPMDLALRPDVTWLVDDEVCTACKALQGKQEMDRSRAEKGNAPTFLHGRVYGVRPKLNGGRASGE